jgi:pathogenesis-related protein 1
MRAPTLPSHLAPVLLTVSLAACGASGSGDTEPADMAGMTAAHNAARAAVMPAATPEIPDLSWSGTVADYAQSWANGCQFMHSGGQYGENIYAGTGSDAAPADVVADWVSEVSNYDYADNTCNGVCGHYTQVVWRDTVHLGCGVAACTSNSPFANGGDGAWQIYVCDYDPPGNFDGMKPY